MSLFLNQDVRGVCSRKTYGKQGDEVTLIADHWDMLIVEGNGVRFPVRKEYVSGTLEEPTAPVEEPAVEAPAPVCHPARKKTRQTKSVITNPTLF